jgi:hypothetical protein
MPVKTGGLMMKHKWYLTLIAISLAALIGSITGCITIVTQEPAPATEQPVSPPTINSFTASPTSVSQGQRTTLSWDVSGATTITIQPEIGSVGPSGSLTLTPNATISYTLTVSNEAGSTTGSATVNVTPVVAGKPDLVITDIWLSGSQVNYKIANIGSGDAKSSHSYLYANDVKQADDWVEPLAAGEERTTSIPNYDWQIQTGANPVSGDFSTHYVKVCANAEDSIEESDKGNNCLTKNWGQTFTYDFVQNAHLAEWRSGAAVITWPKFAGNQPGAAYLEGNALIMCPEQVSNGWIQGRFADFYYNPGTKTTRSSLLEVPENARFTAQVGFKTGATSTDGVVIALGYLDEAGGIVLFPKIELYPGDKSRAYTIDLSNLAGKQTEFILRVEAKGTPEGDCVRWVEPKIVQE